MTLRLITSRTEMNIRKIPLGKERTSRKASNYTAIYEPIFQKISGVNLSRPTPKATLLLCIVNQQSCLIRPCLLCKI
jgi:hypothetical protein